MPIVLVSLRNQRASISRIDFERITDCTMAMMTGSAPVSGAAAFLRPPYVAGVYPVSFSKRATHWRISSLLWTSTSAGTSRSTPAPAR